MQLYQHVNFLYAGTLKTDKKGDASKEEYSWHHQEIVTPVFSPCYQYLIMHTPAIFNWLRKTGVFDERLNRYLKGEKPFAGIQKPLATKIKQLSQQWQIARLCFTAKFYITKSYSQSCQHLTKRNINTGDYHYNYPSKQITLQKYICGNCNTSIKVEAVVKRYPMVLTLGRFQDKIMLDKTQYKLYLAIVDQDKNQCLVKTASGVWYCVGSNGTKIKTEAQVKQTKCQFYFYHRLIPQAKVSGPLPVAKPVLKQILNKPQPTVRADQDQAASNPTKEFDSPTSATYKARIFRTDLRPLKQQTYHPLTYSNDSAYQKTVENMYNKEKQKSNYDLEYDTGKVKKVKKRKFIHKIDFNQTDSQVRRGHIKPIRFKSKFRGTNLDKE